MKILPGRSSSAATGDWRLQDTSSTRYLHLRNRGIAAAIISTIGSSETTSPSAPGRTAN